MPEAQHPAAALVEDVRRYIDKVDRPADLSSYAAAAAAQMLFKNWQDAIPDGYTLEKLLPDIDDTIKHLQCLKDALSTKNITLLD